MSRPLEFRQTTGQRVFNTALVVGAIGLCVATWFTEPGAALWMAVSVAVVLVALYLWRMLSLSVIAEGDELIVRNLWWTTRLHRNDISGFRVAGIFRPPYRTVKVDRRSGRPVEVDVFLSSGLAPSSRRRRDDAVNRLYAWLDPKVNDTTSFRNG